MAASEETWLETSSSDGRQILTPVGRWAVGGLFAVEKEIRAIAEAATVIGEASQTFEDAAPIRP